MSGLPDPARAHALVIGTSAYADENYPDIPAATASARQIYALLRAGRIWGMPEENVHCLADVTVLESAEAIDALARRNGQDALLVYICGHGRAWSGDGGPDGAASPHGAVGPHGPYSAVGADGPDSPDRRDRQAHLALSDSRRDWEFTHLPLRALCRMLSGSGRADRMLILDTPCSADASVSVVQQRSPAGPSRLPGACTLAAGHWAAPDATWQGTGFTPFSGALIEVLSRGVRGPEKFLTPETVFRELWWRLTEGGYPEPGMHVSGAQLLLGRNPGYELAPVRPPYAHLLQTLDAQRAPGPLSADPAAYAHAVADCRAAAHDAAAVELIAKLGAVGLVTDVAEFAGQLYCAGLAGDADHVVAAFAACRREGDIALLAHRMHRQAEVSVDGLLRVLAQRETSVLAGLVAALRARACGDCAATADAISERILRVWPRERHGELLVAWP